MTVDQMLDSWGDEHANPSLTRSNLAFIVVVTGESFTTYKTGMSPYL